MSLRRKQSGQALVMVTLALFAMCGVMGLAVDLGWSYFVKKNAQAAADAAALAAVAAAQKLGFTPPFTCGNTTNQIYCTTSPQPCGSSAVAGNLNSACVYAGLNGFTQGGNVNVLVDADVVANRAFTPLNPNSGTVAVDYWVTVRVNQQVPQLFSAVLGNSVGLVSARATAALTNVIFNASLDLLNRENDPNAAMGTGVDLSVGGSKVKTGSVQAPGGMLVASALNVASGGAAAANLNGSASVSRTPFSDFRGAPGSCVGNGGSNCDAAQSTLGDWTNPPTYNVPDGVTFQDPTTLGKTKTQPPLNTSVAPNYCPVAGGLLQPSNVPAACTSGGALLPGIYYAAASASTTAAATGAQLQYPTGATTFSNNGTSFGQYIFYGGLTYASGGNKTITFAPGAYVFAGTTNTTNAEFTLDNSTTLQDLNTGSTQVNAGELFIFTNYNYNWAPGTMTDGTAWNGGGLYSNGSSSLTPPAVSAFGASNFQYGQGGFTILAGNNPATSINLWGLNPNGTGIPSGGLNAGPLVNYENFLFWQDRSNSTIMYNPDGSIQTKINTPLLCTVENPSAPDGINNVCENTTLASTTSPQMNLLASPNVNMHGYLYQPRGAWLNLQGSGLLNGPLRIITGALSLQGGNQVILTGTSAPITITETALIE